MCGEGGDRCRNSCSLMRHIILPRANLAPDGGVQRGLSHVLDKQKGVGCLFLAVSEKKLLTKGRK